LFQKGLAEGGYVADRNVAFDFRWADEQFDRLPALANDLVRRNVAVIAAFGNAAARAAKAATTTINIAFASSSDPVAVGLVSSLNRPGWNLTGVSILNQELESTRLERLAQVVPHATTIAFLVNPDSVTAGPKLREMENAARLLGRRLQAFNARNESEFEQALLSVVEQRLGAMVVTSDTMFSNKSVALGRAVARHAVPAMGASCCWQQRAPVIWPAEARSKPAQLTAPPHKRTQRIPVNTLSTANSAFGSYWP
jgi:putative ABC transport system substrate-binding protein